MAINSLNDQQYDAVYSRDCSILVSAPAGSGKTKILVNRVMSLIEDDHYNINELLILTFTKAATLEMKQRLKEALNQRLQEDIDDELKEHLEKQLLLINDSYITNFHSFCKDLLSQYGYLIHLDYQFDILESTDTVLNKIFDECLEQWCLEDDFYDFFSQHYEKYSFDEFKKDLLLIHNLSHNIFDFKKQYDHYKETIILPAINDFSHSTFASLIVKRLKETIDAIVEEKRKLDEECLGRIPFYNEETKIKSPYDVFTSYVDKLKDLISHDFDYILAHQNIACEAHRNASWPKGTPQREKDAYKKSLSIIKDFGSAQEDYLYDSIEQYQDALQISMETMDQYLKYVLDLQERYQAYKKEMGVLDFNDLEDYCLTLLEPQYGISEKLYHQLKEIMIDEYQDTNEIQEILINKIAYFDKPEIYKFMVGDMKQSIYRFRNADVNIFKDKYNTYSLLKEDISKTRTKRIDLGFNYRSNKIVLDSINYIFNTIMDTLCGGLEYLNDDFAKLNYDYLRKEGCQSEDDLPQVKADADMRLDRDNRFSTDVLFVCTDKKDDKSLKTEYEARLMAIKVKEMVGHTMLDFYKQPSRPAEYKDIVVLVKQTSNLIDFKKIFDQYNIPNNIVLNKGFYESVEIIDSIAFLKAINNCYDDISLTSVLKGHYRFSNFSDELLLSVKQPDLSMYESLQQSNDPQIIEFMDIYQAFVSYAKDHKVYELFEYFLQQSEYDSFVSSLLNGKQRFSNLQLFTEILKADEDLRLYHILSKIDSYKDNGISVKPAACKESNAVTFMTIHYSKGLEFPIVFVNELAHQFNNDDARSRIIFHKDFGIHTNITKTKNINDYKNVTMRYPNKIKKAISKYNTKDDLDENMRVLYVALTRASQKLILTGAIDGLETIENWQKNVISFSNIDMHNQDYLLPVSMRQSNNFINWIGLSLVRHKDIIQQIKNENFTLQDSQLKNMDAYASILTNNQTMTLREIDYEDNTKHSKFTLSIMDYQDIDSFTYQHNYHHKSQLDIYEDNKNFEMTYDHNIDRSIAVTSIIEDGNRYYPELTFEDDTITPLKATDRGTIIHSVLENYPLDKSADFDKEIDSIIERSHYEETESQLVLNYKPHLLDFINSNVYQLMLDSDHCYKEKAFSFTDDNGQIIHGIFDVICFKDNTITIIDYKTDTISKNTSKEILEELHQGQMDYYKKIMARVFPQATIQAIVYYLQINEYVII